MQDTHTSSPALPGAERYPFESEADPLTRQAALMDPHTRRVLTDAGLKEGMAVLDIGTGPGFVAMLAAEIVGPSGTVIGIDRRESIVENARQRAERRALPQLSFEVGAT